MYENSEIFSPRWMRSEQLGLLKAADDESLLGLAGSFDQISGHAAQVMSPPDGCRDNATIAMGDVVLQ
jgi:hypothetical protein